MSSVSAVNTLLGSTSSSAPSAVDISSILASSVGATTPGIDVTAAVASAIAADRAPETVWNSDITTLSSQTSTLKSIQTATTAITTDLQSLNSLTGPLSARTVISSSSDVTATAAEGTVSGGHTVVVDGLATTGAWYSDLQSSATTTLPSTSFTLTTSAGGTATISTGGGVNTLNDLATAINVDKLGVTATVVSDTTGSRLAIISDSSGTAADFSISSTNYTGKSWSSPDIPTGDTLGANNFTITSGGVTSTIATTKGESYATLAGAINGMDLGVTATGGSDANGTNLSIVSTDGATPFTISEPSFGFTQAVVATNASLVVDGVPIQSGSNTVTGAISGVTLTLLNAEVPSTTTNLTVASNASQISTAINQFVSDYNTAIGLVNAQYTTSSAGSEGVLSADPTVSSLQSTLMQALNYVSTPSSGLTTASTLDSMGISVGTDGTLTVDSTTLDNEIENNPTDVQNFFQGTSLNGFASSMTNVLSNFTDPTSGAFTVDLSSITNSSANYTAQISDFETNYIANQQTILTAMYSSAEIALQQLPTEMAQIQAELGNSPTTNGG